MAHFDAVLPGRVHRVFYERHGRRSGSARSAACSTIAACRSRSSCLRFYENERAVRTASSEQVRQPIFSDGVEQWRHFEPWLGPLKAALGPVLEAYPGAPEFEQRANLRGSLRALGDALLRQSPESAASDSVRRELEATAAGANRVADSRSFAVAKPLALTGATAA